jgi:hypothetical protein
VIELEYRLTGLHPSEQFRVGVNGQTILVTSNNTDDFMTFEALILEPGTWSLDVSLLSNFQQKTDYVSQAQAVIKRLSVSGTNKGGAHECLQCPFNTINTGS